jgi:transposase
VLARPPGRSHRGDRDRPAGAAFVLSCGDPQRNKNYRAALFGGKKSDPVEARAAAHFAVSQRPIPTPPGSPPQRALRQVAARLQATIRQRTRLVNQLHHLLALAFPELALLAPDLTQGWVLELVHRYPTAALLAAATAAVLTAFIGDIDRFDNPGKLVAYFGVLPIEMSSGVDRDGQPRGSRRYMMSQRGNDLVRRYL